MKKRMPKVKQFMGTLEIQAARGVVYFHRPDGECLLRLEGLPLEVLEGGKQIDVRLVELGTPDRHHPQFRPIRKAAEIVT